jgi:hypothetical protein
VGTLAFLDIIIIILLAFPADRWISVRFVPRFAFVYLLRQLDRDWVPVFGVQLHLDDHLSSIF